MKRHEEEKLVEKEVFAVIPEGLQQDVSKAISEGLKNIRRTKYEERLRQKESRRKYNRIETYKKFKQLLDEGG